MNKQQEVHLDIARQRIAALAERVRVGEVSSTFIEAGLQDIATELDQIIAQQSAKGEVANAYSLPVSLLASAAHRMDEALVITDARLDPPGPRIVYINYGFTKITGYTPEEVIGKTPRILQGPETDRAELHRLRHNLQHEQTFHGETINYRKDGTKFVIDWYIKPLRDEHGTITHWMAVQHDVTKRKQDEEALELAERANVQFAAAVSTLTTGVVITNPSLADNPIIFVNPGFCMMTGYSEQEVVGRNCRFLQGPGTDPETVTRLRNAIAARRTITVELLNYCKDGTPFWNELTVDPVFNQDGQLVNFVGLQTDITARKQAEAEREQLFQQTQAAVRARDDFLTVAAHELKTPVTSLRAYAQLLLRQATKGQHITLERLNRVLTTIDQQSIKLVRLTDQLLDVARIESGRLQITRERTNVTELVRGVVDNLQTTTNQHTLVLTAPMQIESMVDPIRLEQVVTNLLTNAIKYSPEDSLITIDIAQTQDNVFTISVTDRGVGIAPEHREHIFDRFYQVQSSDYNGGMGIGLFISRQIVLLHNGRLEAEPLDTGGTRFVVYLPMHTSEVEHEQGAAQ